MSLDKRSIEWNNWWIELIVRSLCFIRGIDLLVRHWRRTASSFYRWWCPSTIDLVDGSIELISIDEGNVVISGFDAVSADNSFVSFDPSLMTDQSFDICLSNDINDLISLMNHKLFLWFQQTNPLSVDRSFDRNERYHSIKDRMMKEPHIWFVY